MPMSKERKKNYEKMKRVSEKCGHYEVHQHMHNMSTSKRGEMKQKHIQRDNGRSSQIY